VFAGRKGAAKGKSLLLGAHTDKVPQTIFYRPGEGAGDHTYDEYYELKGFGARAQNAGSPGGHLVREGIISAPFVAPAQALEASAE